MNIKNLLLGLTMMTTMVGFSQEEEDRECLRMRFLAGEELKIKNYSGAATYYLKGEKLCGGYDQANYDRLTGSLINAMVEEQDDTKIGLLADTLAGVYDRAVAAGVYGDEKAYSRAQYELSRATPNRQKADSLFKVGRKANNNVMQEGYMGLYYYNLLMVYNATPAAKKSEMKKRLINDYFDLSNTISKENMSAETQSTLNSYLNYAVTSCEDLLPELNDFMKSLPQETAMKKETVNNFIGLLEEKGCEESKEYAMLIDTLIAIDPSIDAFIARAKLMKAKKQYSQAIQSLRDAKGMTEDAAKIEEIEYTIGEIQLLNQGAHKSAYNTFMGITGDKRGDALMLAAQCVAQSSNDCGARTVDRKMNYYYAVELLEKARANGASVGSLISKYEALYPSQGELFDNSLSKGQTADLSCWGVTVTIK